MKNTRQLPSHAVYVFTAMMLILPASLCGQSKSFLALLDSAGLQFKMPAHYQEVPTKENPDLYYCFAMKNNAGDFEVRYSIWPMQESLKDYEECKVKLNCMMVHPNSMFKSIAEANVLNMTAGQDVAISGFPKEAVKKEFNADIGGSAFFEFNCEFGKGYKYGFMVVLHKDDVADFIITFLGNDKARHSDLMLESFYALTFK